MKPRFAKLRVPLCWLFLVPATWLTHLCHVAMLAPPSGVHAQTVATDSVRWFPKEKFGINQLVLSGTPFARGFGAGQKTSGLLLQEEQNLLALFKQMVPSPIVRTGFVIGLMRWFWGLDKYYEPWTTEEMYGISLSAPHEYDSYADRFTRQLAYHGLHEVGQMFVDMGPEGMGCTLFAIPSPTGWVIGRNFDFEGGRIFDEQKIVKWVFPSEGNAFVSVIWAGMVGAVTGVNEHGVYISVNAAGTTDFRRFGTPSTLVILKALQFAKTVEEARYLIEDATVFITDIYIVADSKTVLRIEKSPRKTRVLPVPGPTVVTNHLIDDVWRDDRINIFRRDKLTSEARSERGEELLQTVLPGALKSGRSVESTVLSFMRDKRAVGGARLHTGNRAAIDALIATHGVIFNSGRNVLYVSEGPALVGALRGYDLKKSFRERFPVEIDKLPADTQISVGEFRRIKAALAGISQAEGLIKKKRCEAAEKLWARVPKIEHNEYFIVEGKLNQCLGKMEEAKASFHRALDLKPPYEAQRKFVNKSLESLEELSK